MPVFLKFFLNFCTARCDSVYDAVVIRRVYLPFSTRASPLKMKHPALIFIENKGEKNSVLPIARCFEGWIFMIFLNLLGRLTHRFLELSFWHICSALTYCLQKYLNSNLQWMSHFLILKKVYYIHISQNCRKLCAFDVKYYSWTLPFHSMQFPGSTPE